MKISVPAIPEEGLHLHFDQATPWFAALLQARLGTLYRIGQAAGGEVDLLKTLQNVSLHGEVTLHLSPPCARCGQIFETVLSVPLQRNLAPYFSGPREELLSEDEEIELSAEDMEFSFYHNEEIDLGELVGEEIQLALPMRFLCQESCLGLCPRCGVNRNETPCACAVTPDDSPFATLKDLRIK